MIMKTALLKYALPVLAAGLVVFAVAHALIVQRPELEASGRRDRRELYAPLRYLAGEASSGVFCLVRSHVERPSFLSHPCKRRVGLGSTIRDSLRRVPFQFASESRDRSRRGPRRRASAGLPSRP